MPFSNAIGFPLMSWLTTPNRLGLLIIPSRIATISNSLQMQYSGRSLFLVEGWKCLDLNQDFTLIPFPCGIAAIDTVSHSWRALPYAYLSLCPAQHILRPVRLKLGL